MAQGTLLKTLMTCMGKESSGKKKERIYDYDYVQLIHFAVT